MGRRSRLAPSERTFQRPGLESRPSPCCALRTPRVPGAGGERASAAGICWALSQFLQQLGGPGRGPTFRSPGHQASLAGLEETPCMATPQCFQAARFLGVPRNTAPPACGQQASGAGWGAGLSGQWPQNPAQPSSDLAPDTLLPEAGRGSGWWPPKAWPTWAGHGPCARRPHRDGEARMSGAWPPAGVAPSGLDTAAPRGLTLLGAWPSSGQSLGPSQLSVGASPLPTLTTSSWGSVSSAPALLASLTVPKGGRGGPCPGLSPPPE